MGLYDLGALRLRRWLVSLGVPEGHISMRIPHSGFVSQDEGDSRSCGI